MTNRASLGQKGPSCFLPSGDLEGAQQRIPPRPRALRDHRAWRESNPWRSDSPAGSGHSPHKDPSPYVKCGRDLQYGTGHFPAAARSMSITPPNTAQVPGKSQAGDQSSRLWQSRWAALQTQPFAPKPLCASEIQACQAERPCCRQGARATHRSQGPPACTPLGAPQPRSCPANLDSGTIQPESDRRLRPGGRPIAWAHSASVSR